MTTTFRTAGAWGAGKGADLTPAEVDNNFYDKETRITAIEAAGVAVGVASITVSGDQMTVHMTDASIQGPFTLPTAEWTSRGDWQPSSLYFALDVVTHHGSVYLVNVDHTSALTFDAGALDGTTEIYSLLWTFPSTPSSTRTGTTFTPELADANTYNRMTNVAGCTVTIPDNADVPFPIDTELHFRQVAVGTVVIADPSTASAVVINPVSGYLNESACEGATFFIKKIATDEWDIGGLLAVAVTV